MTTLRYASEWLTLIAYCLVREELKNVSSVQFGLVTSCCTRLYCLEKLFFFGGVCMSCCFESFFTSRHDIVETQIFPKVGVVRNFVYPKRFLPESNILGEKLLVNVRAKLEF